MTERELTSCVGWLENNDGLLSVQEVNQMYRLYGICIDIYTKFDKVTDTICIEYCINPFVWNRLVNLSMIFNTSLCNSSQLTLDLASSRGKWWARPIPSGQTIVNLGPDRLTSWFLNMKRHHSPEQQTMKIVVPAFLNEIVGWNICSICWRFLVSLEVSTKCIIESFKRSYHGCHGFTGLGTYWLKMMRPWCHPPWRLPKWRLERLGRRRHCCRWCNYQAHKTLKHQWFGGCGMWRYI